MRKRDGGLCFRHLDDIRFVNRPTLKVEDTDLIGSTEDVLYQRDINVLDVETNFRGLWSCTGVER